MKVGSWGRLSCEDHEAIGLGHGDRAGGVMAAGTPGLAYGMGRSYGDVCLNPGGRLWLTRGLDRFIGFDQRTGRLSCEAGVLLRDIQRLAIPRGWSLPVTPGTQMVTVGGAIANDVHGKNHHRFGSFGDHVLGLQLARTDGQTVHCGPGQQADWFAATVGGLGLTGVILQAEIQLRRIAGPWMETETVPFQGLEAFFQLADDSEADWEHTVSWIDCLSGQGAGRGLFMRANPAEVVQGPSPKGRALRMPLVPPFSLVNGLTLRPFNALYYRLNAWRAGRAFAHVEPFLYPLDNLHDWNRMYGPRGFYQYQCVVPRAGGHDAIDAMLKAISRAGEGSFLAVLKTFGEREAPGLLSFPRPGVTLALDFPNRGEATLRLLDRLDSTVREVGGRIYMAKDARMPRDLFESGYPRWPEFVKYRDPGISSGLSRRLLGS